MLSPVRVRIAPSPTGLFHAGTARTALFNWLFARHHGGVFVLRIEDTDEARNRPEWTEGILSTLNWLGLDWDEGPFFQSQRSERHAGAAVGLLELGLAYYCDCSVEARDARAKARGGPPGYDGYCRNRDLAAAPGRALRFRVPEGVTAFDDAIRGRVSFDNHTIEDFVIVKGNGGAIFHLANTVDDLDMAITHVIRGEEHLPNTPKALLLWAALAPSAPPPVFAHLPLLVNERRQKLSKRRDKVAVESFRDEGFVMEALRNYLALLGWSPGGDREILSLAEMVDEFDLAGVNNSPAFFDLRKLTSFNERYIQAMDDAAFIEACQPFLARGPWNPEDFDPASFVQMVPPIKERTKVLGDVVSMVDFLFRAEPDIDEESWEKGVVRLPFAREVLSDAEAHFADCPWQSAGLHDVTLAIAERHGVALGKAQAPIRVAVTGRTVGPPLFESLEVLGRDRTLRRIESALARLAQA